MFRFTVRNMLGNATSQDVMNFRTVIEGRNSNHVDQSRDFKVLQTPQPVPAKSQKRWNIGKINTYIIYTAYTYSYYVLTWLILEWNKKLNWDRCKISHFLKQTSGGFLKFFFFFLRQTQLQPIFMHFETDVHGVEIRLRCFPFNASCHFMFFKRARKICHLSRTIVSLESLGMSYIWKLCHQQFLVGICKESVF